MRCPYCEHEDTKVRRTGKFGAYVERSRICPGCHRKWTTYEVYDDAPWADLAALFPKVRNPDTDIIRALRVLAKTFYAAGLPDDPPRGDEDG